MTSASADVLTSPAAAARRSPGPGVITWIVLLLAAGIVAALELTLGVVFVPLDQVLTILAGGDAERISWTRIVLDYRLPRVLTALTAGAALGVTGLLLQTVFRNPLADPWFLGLVHSARFGVALFIVVAGAGGTNVLAQLGLLSNLGLVVAAGAGALLMTAALILLAPRVSPVTLLLTGLMLGQAADGMISVVLHFTGEPQARVFAGWNDGNFATVTFAQLQILAIVAIAGIAGAAVLSKSLDVMLLGDDYARSLGVGVTVVRVATVSVAALLTGAVTAYCGPIAFLGILAPHLARVVFQAADHRTLIPASLLLGATLAGMADLIAHLPWSRHFLHLNAMLGLVGGPVVVILLLRRRGLRSMEF
jgi:iron complex transport system permease protein